MTGSLLAVRILVVEDEVGVASALERGLTADGFAVDVADNGIDGLFLARTHPYAAIVLDIMLPGTNGYVVCRTLRDEGNWTPILMLTAKDGDYDQAEGLDTGADDYLTKPFSYVVLLAHLRALIRRSGRAAPTVMLEVGDLRLDPVKHRCWRGEVEVELSPRAMAVLEFLMRRPDDVVSKHEILSGVWDDAFDGDPNIVEVYVRHLRKKIDIPFGADSIQTVRGAGYRLLGSPP